MKFKILAAVIVIPDLLTPGIKDNIWNKPIKIEDKVIADSCEALIGAVYLDKGFLIVENLILNLWKKNIKDSIVTQIDAKTKLQEFSLKKFKKLPTYKIISNTGPRHKPIFKVSVSIKDFKSVTAIGSNLKNAEETAASKLLSILKNKINLKVSGYNNFEWRIKY